MFFKVRSCTGTRTGDWYVVSFSQVTCSQLMTSSSNLPFIIFSIQYPKIKGKNPTMTKYTIAFLFALLTLNFKYQYINGELADDSPIEGSDYHCNSCECPAVHDSDSSNFKRELNNLKTDLDSCTLSLESNFNITSQLNLCRSNVTTYQAELSGWKGQIATIQSDLQSCESKQIKSVEIHEKSLQECEAAKVVLINDVHELQSKTKILIPKIEKLEERERSFTISEGSLQAATSKCLTK